MPEPQLSLVLPISEQDFTEVFQYYKEFHKQMEKPLLHDLIAIEQELVI